MNHVSRIIIRIISKIPLNIAYESRGIFCETTRNLGIKWNFRLIPNHAVENLEWRTPRLLLTKLGFTYQMVDIILQTITKTLQV